MRFSSTNSLSGWRKFLSRTTLAAGVAALMAACGGGGNSGRGPAAQSGTVQIGITDADGDFLRYDVDVAALDLTRADGTVVHTLPNATRVDFTQYTDLTEFLTGATVPAGNYTKASVTLNFATADIQVEINGAAVPVPVANITDPLGNALGQYTLDVKLDRLDNGQPLHIAPGIPRFLSLDFNLDASNTVDVSNPVSPGVKVAPFLVADIDQTQQKDIRLRGTLVSVDTANSSYVVDVRPFNRRDADRDFGQATVHTDSNTVFDVNGTVATGAAGLQALQAAGAGTPTIARGTFTVATHSFLAAAVDAGDSVPGHRKDAVLGTVIARSGDTLTVRGATLIRSDQSVIFHDNVTVTIGPNTVVKKWREGSGSLDIGAISVGQRVEVRGTVTNPSVQALALDATSGRVRLLLTHIGGTLNAGVSGNGPLALNLQHIDGRRLSLFDFSGTGMTPMEDANPGNYQVDTTGLNLTIAQGTPVRVFGFVVPFGQATATEDFTAKTVVDLDAGHAELGIGWGLTGTTTPFSSINASGLVLDLGNAAIGLRHHIVVGGIALDLKNLPASPTIQPAATGPMRFGIKQAGSLQVFSNFGDFEAALAALLDGSNKAYGLFAEGIYDQAMGTFTARTIGIAVGTTPAP
jgi:hypothetical protein